MSTATFPFCFRLLLRFPHKVYRRGGQVRRSPSAVRRTAAARFKQTGDPTAQWTPHTTPPTQILIRKQKETIILHFSMRSQKSCKQQKVHSNNDNSSVMGTVHYAIYMLSLTLSSYFRSCLMVVSLTCTFL